MQEPGGWETIAAQPAWGRFKFGHTEPSRSNSGLLTLVLMAYEFANKDRSLSLEDVAQQRFLDWLRSFEQAVARPARGNALLGLQNSSDPFPADSSASALASQGASRSGRAPPLSS